MLRGLFASMSMRHRLIIGIAAILGGLVWLLATEQLRAADGGSGYSLFAAPNVGMSILSVAALGLPAVLLALISSAAGHPLSGVFVYAVALCMLAVRGGPIDGWLFRALDIDRLSTAYGGLVVEVLIWQVGLIAVVLAVARLREQVRSRLPEILKAEHGVESRFRLPDVAGLLPTVVCAVISGVLAYFLIRSTRSGQVIGALVLAFAVGALTTQLIFQQRDYLGLLLSPAIVAIVAYVWILSAQTDTDELIRTWYSLNLTPKLPGGLAFALPIHYASAALAGCCVGIGMAFSFETEKVEASD